MTYLIWRKRSGRGLGKTPWSPLLWKEPLHQKEPPHQEESHCRWSEQSSLPAPPYWTHHLCPNEKGQCLLRAYPGSPKAATTTTPGFSPWVPEDLATPPLEDVYLTGAMTWMDLSWLESLEMTISLTPVMGKVHYCLQAWSLARISLPSTSTQRYLELFLRDKEPWVIITLHYILRTLVLSKDSSRYPLSQWYKL